MLRRTRRRTRGVTLTELLVVLVIIGLLATLALPAGVTRAREARINAAQADVQSLANAEEMACAIHGFYIPLQVLDDIPDRGIGSPTTIDDMITRESNTIKLTDCNIKLTSPNSLLQIDVSDLYAGEPRAVDTFGHWQGPFMQFQRYFILDTDDTSQSTLQDQPLDPWGNPYFLYWPSGIVGTGASVFANSTTSRPSANDMQSTSFSDGNLVNTGQRFDRWAVVSFGPDGVAASPPLVTPGQGIGDDIVYYFGTVIPESTFDPNVIIIPTP